MSSFSNILKFIESKPHVTNKELTTECQRLLNSHTAYTVRGQLGMKNKKFDVL